MKRKNYKFLLILVLLLAFYIFRFISIDYGNKTDSIFYNNEKANEFSSGWELVTADGNKSIKLPAKLKIPVGEWYTITNKIPFCDNCNNDKILAIRLSMSEVRVFSSDQLIYSYYHMEGEHPNNLPASMWHFIDMPPCEDRADITIEFKSDTSAFSGVINPIYIGSKTAVFYKLFDIYGADLVLALLTLLLGLFMLAYYLIMKIKFEYENLFYLSLLIIFISLWLITETKLLQFFIGNYFLITKSTFIFLGIIPLPLLLYMDNSYVKHHKSMTPFFIVATIINSFVTILLHYAGVMDFFYSVKITISLLFLASLYELISMSYEVFKLNNREVVKTLFPFMVPFASGLIEFVLMLNDNYVKTGVYLQFGLFVYMIILVMYGLQDSSYYIAKYHDSIYFKKLAYNDLLTRAMNRTAYSDQVEKICKGIDSIYGIKGKYSKGFFLVLLDLNDLKHINDNYGHLAGDDALKTAYQLIREAFDNKFTVYRIGGDEFACIIHDMSTAYVANCVARLEELCKKESENREYNISIPAGFAYYAKGEYENYDAFYNAVDKRMYQNKIEFKSRPGYRVDRN